jgi:hypothetical protein
MDSATVSCRGLPYRQRSAGGLLTTILALRNFARIQTIFRRLALLRAPVAECRDTGPAQRREDGMLRRRTHRGQP